MKIGTLAVFTLGFACSISLAQVPNGDFESWTGTDPTGWATSNIPALGNNITASSDAHGGSNAVKMEVVTLPAVGPWHPVIQSGPEGTGFAMNARYATVSGWYKYSPVGGDRLGFNFAFTKGGISATIVAQGAQALTSAATSYTKFSIPMTYFTNDTPDTCYLQFQIIGPGTSGTDFHVGSFALIDDLTMEGTATTGVDPVAGIPMTFGLDQNYPNPFNPSTTITMRVAHAGPVTLEVFNILGDRVATLVNDVRSAGTYAVRFDGSQLASGMYFARLQNFGQTAIQKMVLTK